MFLTTAPLFACFFFDPKVNHTAKNKNGGPWGWCIFLSSVHGLLMALGVEIHCFSSLEPEICQLKPVKLSREVGVVINCMKLTMYVSAFPLEGSRVPSSFEARTIHPEPASSLLPPVPPPYQLPPTIRPKTSVDSTEVFAAIFSSFAAHGRPVANVIPLVKPSAIPPAPAPPANDLSHRFQFPPPIPTTHSSTSNASTPQAKPAEKTPGYQEAAFKCGFRDVDLVCGLSDTVCINEFPWLALLLKKSTRLPVNSQHPSLAQRDFCTGALVHGRFVLTARSCAENL
jgi:hypothetical protein